MKKTILTLAATAAALTGLSGTANAAPFGGNVNQKEAQIAQRIDQGIRSGALTRGEAQNLRIRLAQIQRLEQNYRRGDSSARAAGSARGGPAGYALRRGSGRRCGCLGRSAARSALPSD